MRDPQAVIAGLQATGLMVHLRPDLPVAALLEIGDALLAAPLLVAAISCHAPTALPTLTEFDRRYGSNLLVGASEVTSLTTARDALWAGARFIITPGVDDALVDFAQQYNLLCLPHLTTLRDLQRFSQVNLPLGLIAPRLTPLLAATELDPRRTIACIADEQALIGAAQVGVSALACGDLLFPTPDWSHAQLITQARRLRTNWARLSSAQE